jgi:hypothetical protein
VGVLPRCARLCSVYVPALAGLRCPRDAGLVKQWLIAGAGALVAGGALFMTMAEAERSEEKGADPVARSAEGDRDMRPSARESGRSFDRDAPVDSRIRALEDEVVKLRRDVENMRLRTRVGGVAGGGHAASDERDSGGQIDERVREVIEEDREERVEIETDRRRDRMRERNAELVAELKAAANLTDTQSSRIDELWNAEAEQMLSLMMAARSGERDRREIRGEVDTLREATDAEAKGLLGAGQRESYDEMRPRGRRGGGPGGGARRNSGG